VTRPGLRETLGVWLLFGLVGLATVVTYTRLEPEEIYHTSMGGLAGGLGRALVFLNYPVVLAALATLPVSLDRLGPRPAWIVHSAVSIALCALVVTPGTVDKNDLDAKLVNALPAAGVAIALGLSLLALRRGGLGYFAPRLRGDRVRLALAAVLIVPAIPWLFAELGFYAPWPFYADELTPEPGHPDLRAVHLGLHHGMDGVLLTLTALGLSRVLPQLRSDRLKHVSTAYLSILLVYGLANAAEDFWLEQVVKRGWTEQTLPTVTQPSLSAAWAVLLALAAGIYFSWRAFALRPEEPRPSANR
jgi:hypothetical protein